MDDGTRLVSMTSAEVADYLEREEVTLYAAENVRAGFWTEEEAGSRALQQQSQILPDRARTQGHHFYWIEAALSQGRRSAARGSSSRAHPEGPRGFSMTCLSKRPSAGRATECALWVCWRGRP
jgi:hypothetical protein